MRAKVSVENLFARASCTVFVLVCMVGVGCGSTSPPSPRTLRVLMTDDWVTPPFLDAVREFEREHPGVRVVVDRGPIRLMPEAVRAGISSGAPPDVVQGHAFSAAAEGLAQPLDDLWRANLEVDDFFPGAIEDVTWSGRLYGVPLDTNAMVLMYNGEMFRAAGVPEPSADMTFEEFESLARAMTTPDGTRRGIAIPASNWWIHGWILANGGETMRFGPEGAPQLTLDSPRVIEVVRFLSRLVDAGYAFGPRGADFHSSDTLALFRSGRVAMHANGSWDLVSLRRSDPDGEYRATLMPKGPGGEGGSTMGGSSMYVPPGSRHRELAFEFMRSLISDSTALRLAREEGRLPVRLKVFDDPFFSDPDMRVFLEQLKTARPPRLPVYPDADRILRAAVAEALQEGGRDAAAVLTEAQRQAEGTLVLRPA
jgi:multiple sugar transport system substrate-binding protein